MASVLFLGGCVSSILPSLKEPDRLYDPQDEIAAIRQQVGPIGWGIDTPPTPEQRNSYISLRMYAIDQNYTIYEKQLTHEAQETGLVASLVNLGLTGAGSVAPTAQVGKALSAAATGFTGASQAYDKDVLLAQSIQNLQTQMRADRNAKASIILTSMRCPVSSYNMGMVLSDLEEYYRAGTLPNALITITKTVGDAEQQAKGAKAAANPAAAIQQVGAARVDQAASIDTQPISSDGATNCASLAATIAKNTGQAAHTVTTVHSSTHVTQSTYVCSVPSPLHATPGDCQTILADLKSIKSAASQSEARQLCREISALSSNPGTAPVCTIN